MDPLIDAVKGGIGGFSEAISLADDLDGVAQQLGDLGKKEVQARAAWRRKQTFVSGDYGYVDAVAEWKRVKEAQEAREMVRQEVIRRWGHRGWDEILQIEERQKEDAKRLYTEDGYDREAMNRLKWLCFGAAGVVTYILWQTCMLPMEILIASGCGG
jgi:hypothetical protein